MADPIITATLLLGMCFSSVPSKCVIHKLNDDNMLIHMCYKKARKQPGMYRTYIATFKEKTVVINLGRCEGPI